MRELDFRFYLGDTKIGAPFHGLRAFFTTPQVGCCCGLEGWAFAAACSQSCLLRCFTLAIV